MKSLLAAIFALLLAAGPILAVDPPSAPGKQDRCPVCGMFVAPYPEWIAVMVFADGSQFYFDGGKDLFRYYFELPEEHAPHSRQQITAVYVTEYYSTRLMQADALYFVVGSDVYGPMGHELIPVAGREAAMTFLRDHQGREILTFGQVTPAKLPTN